MLGSRQIGIAPLEPLDIRRAGRELLRQIDNFSFEGTKAHCVSRVFPEATRSLEISLRRKKS